MPVQPSRRRALAGAGVAATTLGVFATGLGAQPRAVAATAQPATTDTPALSWAIAEALKSPEDTTSIALWGSSSMEGGLGEEFTPKPVYVDEELSLTYNPLAVYNVAYGAQWSNHSTILRGIDTPYVALPRDYSGGRVEVRVDTPVPPLWSFTCHGQLSSGLRGTLTGSKDSTQWFFEADGPGESGAFISEWREKTAASRHVVWTGKNNIADLEQVDADVDALVNAARDPLTDVIVLGHWVTQRDLQWPHVIDNVHALNARQAERYGERFIDVQALLMSDEALHSEPLWELDLLNASDTQSEREQGIVPTPLRGTDGIHLSGWGNLLVARALIERMKELRWV